MRRFDSERTGSRLSEYHVCQPSLESMSDELPPVNMAEKINLGNHDKVNQTTRRGAYTKIMLTISCTRWRISNDAPVIWRMIIRPLKGGGSTFP